MFIQRVAIGALFLCALNAHADEPAPPPFEVQEYRVLGNTVLTNVEIEKILYPLLGPNKTIRDVEQARVALETGYHARGYGTVFVDIPEQEIDRGIVRLHVTEAKLTHTRVTGANYFLARDIREALPAATPQEVPHLPSLQAQLSDLNTQTRDRSVIPVLKAGAAPGTVDLNLKVDDHLPLHGSLEVNNQYTADTSPLRTLASTSYDNLFNRLDSLALQYQTSPEEKDEVSVWVASYTAHLDDAGRRLTLFYVDSNSDVAAVGTLAVLGKGKIFGARFVQPWITGTSMSHSLTLGADYKDFGEDIRLDPETGLHTPISYMNLSAGYAGNGGSGRWHWSAGTTANFGVRGLANDEAEFENKRFKARPNYLFLRSDLGLDIALPWDFRASLKASGQFAVEPLISNEEFSIGGAQTVRGYLEAEELGDMGFAATAQLVSPSWRPFISWAQLSGFVFYDGGRVNSIDSLPGQPTSSALRSWGAGIEIEMLGHVNGALTWADPLLSGSNTRVGDSRWLFSIRGIW
jgi:hemolysin activation/secretion protein